MFALSSFLNLTVIVKMSLKVWEKLKRATFTIYCHFIDKTTNQYWIVVICRPFGNKLSFSVASIELGFLEGLEGQTQKLMSDCGTLKRSFSSQQLSVCVGLLQVWGTVGVVVVEGFLRIRGCIFRTILSVTVQCLKSVNILYFCSFWLPKVAIQVVLNEG